jgi:uncharacterized protein YmfQ (DUF2313 family)
MTTAPPPAGADDYAARAVALLRAQGPLLAELRRAEAAGDTAAAAAAGAALDRLAEQGQALADELDRQHPPAGPR